MAAKSTQSKRHVRSYVVRSGRLTGLQRKAIERHWKSHVVDFSNQSLNLAALFSRAAPVTVEIGFGMGASLINMAQQEPLRNFLGIEVYKPGIGKVLHEIENRGINNLKIICRDAIDVFRFGLNDKSLDRILIFFPDPWHKKRHQKRRLIQTDFVEILSSKLTKDGVLHLATDWEPYAEQMKQVIEASPFFKNKIGGGCYWLNPDRPSTKFEERGKRLGHNVWDLLFVKAR